MPLNDIICGEVIAEFGPNCDTKGTGGMEQGIVLINRAHIDLTALTKDTTFVAAVGGGTPVAGTSTHKVTALALQTGFTGFGFSALPGKSLMSAGFTFNRNEDAVNDYTHTITGRIFGNDEAAYTFIKSLGEDAELVAVIEEKDKGTNNESAFKVYGLDKGLKLSELVYNTNENKGTIPITLSSVEPDLEPFPPYLLQLTDYATTLAAFQSKFSA